MNDVFTALQATLGGFFVNNFNLFGRTWQVNIQGEAADRRRCRATSGRSTCATSTARWCRCARSPTLRFVVGPQVITRYNNYRSITINGSPAPGGSSGAALAAMEEVSDKTLPPGYGFEWTGTAYRSRGRSGQTGPILGARGAVRLPVPGRPLRELDDPDAGAAVGRGRRARRLCAAS